jgi:hypothetical protein
LAEIENLAAVDQHGIVPRQLLDGLMAIAEHAPLPPRTAVPVHADCHWGNWLARDRSVTALLDFEWARFGEPADDWFFLARFSGPRMETVLDLIARATTTPAEALRSQCEVRDAAYLASDLRAGLERPGARAGMVADRLRGLEELIVGHYWWNRTQRELIRRVPDPRHALRVPFGRPVMPQRHELLRRRPPDPVLPARVVDVEQRGH